MKKDLTYTVIITAHDRDKYLLDAIKSVLFQKIKYNEKTEIIVVKNFKNEAIDSYLSKNNINNIITDSISLAEKQALGIQNSKGDYILFLEDDDMFRIDKISEISNLLENSNDRIDFIYNDASTITPKTHVEDPEFYMISDKDSHLEVFNVSYINFKIFKKIIKKYHPYMYNSRIAVSRALAFKCLDGLKNVDIATETFWFLCAVEKGYNIAFINKKLTLYRIHSSSYSQLDSPLFKRSGELLIQRYLKSFEWLATYFKNKMILDFISEQKLYREAQLNLLYGTSKIDKIKVILQLLQNSIKPNTFQRYYSASIMVLLLISLVTNKSRNLYYKIMS
ncbi:glycosyltransferase [Acidianus sulfidivorans JP7]|uniref:Glycosyltransferase family 2 protein n=1 Tax=Acidianus sulfidivorans JP7 TaxID=619593 RepID=A0A2U9IJN0_9CREN|nr:glycosyltransferase family 2 protein [Acidianus sulfidivorans]AWR96247.1 glycosyltransferase [Acidianus sulfidivorans JP7]